MMRSIVAPRNIFPTVLVSLLFAPGVVPGQEDLFTLAIEGPEALGGRPGQAVSATYHATLKHEGSGKGAMGWSFGIATENIRITRATSTFLRSGGLPDPEGTFSRLDYIDPAKNGGLEGVVFSVALTTQGLEDAVLPPNTTQRVLSMESEAVIPVGEGVSRFEYRRGLIGRGQPVDVVVTQNGNSASVEMLPLEVRFGPAVLRRGDANSDGSVNISDYIWILNELFLGGMTSACADAADANDDGTENISDALYLLNFLFSGSSPIPSAPGPNLCGPDPTEDELDCAGNAAGCT
jgi:hypothetical protein